MLRAFKILVFGKVQGVGFRYWTVVLANQLCIKGWVRNKADGSVEIYAEASTERMGEFMYALKYEHPKANVENLTSEEVDVKGYNQFSIK